ncbi:MAG: type II toxin-antitoxin system HicB family antitoxin [Chloroflexota bacterium]|nr:type II toxin-antitoxin system HicB family antitoxin [Chloroflexota bacterium]
MSTTSTTRRYTVLLTPDPEEGGYTVTVPALPGCITEGDTVEEALTNAREAIKCHLEGLAADGEPIPEEQAHPELALVEV